MIPDEGTHIKDMVPGEVGWACKYAIQWSPTENIYRLDPHARVYRYEHGLAKYQIGCCLNRYEVVLPNSLKVITAQLRMTIASVYCGDSQDAHNSLKHNFTLSHRDKLHGQAEELRNHHPKIPVQVTAKEPKRVVIGDPVLDALTESDLEFLTTVGAWNPSLEVALRQRNTLAQSIQRNNHRIRVGALLFLAFALTVIWVPYFLGYYN
jgi:hypothetical protein